MTGTNRRLLMLMASLFGSAVVLTFSLVLFWLVHGTQGCGDRNRAALANLVRDSGLIGRPLAEVQKELEGAFGDGEVPCTSSVVGSYACEFIAICGSGATEKIKFSIEVDDSMKVIDLPEAPSLAPATQAGHQEEQPDAHRVDRREIGRAHV